MPEDKDLGSIFENQKMWVEIKCSYLELGSKVGFAYLTLTAAIYSFLAANYTTPIFLLAPSSSSHFWARP